MIEVKKSLVRQLLPKRDVLSHKGQNGRVLIVGGSIDYFGAPVLAGLGALYSGADLAYLYVPESNFNDTRNYCADFIVKKYPGEYLTPRATESIIEFGKKCHCLLIGPGLGEREQTVEAVVTILNELHIPTVIDADGLLALKKIEKFPLQQPIVVTPHKVELQELIDREVNIDENDQKSLVLLRSLAMDLHINVLLKGHSDYIASDEGFVEVNRSGNAGMTVGGTGDVLAGMVASFMAQGLEGFDAARCGAYLNGKAGDLLRKKMGYCYTASDLAKALPEVILLKNFL